ncbi:unnamed protein product [Pylaiella littoralis]
MHHDGLRQRPKKNAQSGGAAAGGGSANGGAAQGGGDGAISDANYDSDEEVGSGLDECLTRNATTRVEKDRDAHYRRAEKIVDPGKEAYKKVWHLKNHDPKPKKDQPPPQPTPNDPEGWVLGGLPKDEESEAFKRRNKHQGSRHFTLSNDLLQRLPKVDREGLEAVRDCVDGKGAALPFRFFKEAFPEECQDIVIDETNKYADFCAETANPSPLQEERHRDKKWRKGWQELPAEKNADGKLVAASTRQHLHGVMGGDCTDICIFVCVFFCGWGDGGNCYQICVFLAAVGVDVVSAHQGMTGGAMVGGYTGTVCNNLPGLDRM